IAYYNQYEVFSSLLGWKVSIRNFINQSLRRVRQLRPFELLSSSLNTGI
ncbi:hypothetical protein PHET_00442, partial [Paragonimus heterotremus]